MHQIRVGVHHGALGHQPLNLDLAALNALFGGQCRAGDALPHVVAAGVHLIFARLQLGDVQHILDEPGQAAHLLADHAQIVVVQLRGNGAVQHTVHKALHAGHGGAQFVGDVAHEVGAGRVNGLQIGGHVVEGHGQLGHLVLAFHRHTGGEIPRAELACRLGNAPQRQGEPGGEHHAEQAGNQQHQPRREDEGAEHIRHIAVQRRDVGGGKRIPPHLARSVGEHTARGVLAFVVHAAQRAGVEHRLLPARHLVQHIPGDLRAQRLIKPRCQNHVALGVGQQQAGIAGFADDADGPLHPVPVLFAELRQVLALLQQADLLGRHLHHAAEGAFALADEVAHGEVHLHKAHHRNARHQQDGRGGEVHIADGLAHMPVQSFTSNI